MLTVKICSLHLLILRKVLNSIMTGCAFLISRLLWLCTHVRPSTFSGPPVACVAGVWKGTGRGFRARGLAPKLPSLPFRTPANHAMLKLASRAHADVLLARHAICPNVGKERLTKPLISDRPFDFWGGGGVWPYGWLQKKISCRLISKEKNSRKEITGGKNSYTEKKISFMAYNSFYSLSWRIIYY